jgi:hypothetical protein
MRGRHIAISYPWTSEGIEPGDYWIGENGKWEAACPVPRDEQGFLLIAALCAHHVVEHDDGTITVSPSILVGGDYSGVATREWVDKHTWHGFLEHGVWREA